jgi:hypothetical protein
LKAITEEDRELKKIQKTREDNSKCAFGHDIIGKNLAVLMREGKERTVLSLKIVEAIQRGELIKLKQIIESQGGKDKVDFTAV